MKKHVLTALFVLGLSAAVALAQAAPGGAQSGSPESSPAGATASSPDQMGQQSAPMSEQQPNMGKQKEKEKKSSSMANVDDETLHRQVHEQLASNPDLQNVQITVKNGVVTLDGTVPNKSDKKEAKKLAKSVPGVRGVKEHLTISASASAAAPSSTGGVSGQAASTEPQPSAQPSTGAMAGQAGAATSTENQPSAQPSTGAAAGQTSATTGTTTGAAPSSTAPSGAAAGEMGQSSAAAATAGTPCSSLSSQAGATGAASSVNLASQIQSEICKDQTLASSNITVSQEGNQIILSGTAPSTDVKDKASDIAMRFANGMSLVNNIQVSGQASEPPSTAGGVSGSVGGAANPPSAPSAEQPTVSGQAGAGAQTPETGATGAAQPPAVSGQAGAGAQTPESGAAAGATGAQPSTAMNPADEQLRTQIETALRQEPTLSNDNINVNLTADSVELSGTVATGKDRQTAKRIAESFAGNRKVVDHLTVTGQGSKTPPDKE